MTAVLAVLVFAVVWLVITAALGWGIEAVLHHWVERRFGVKARYTYSRGMAWRITGSRKRWHLWAIQTIHVLGIMMAIVVGCIVAIYVMLWVALLLR